MLYTLLLAASLGWNTASAIVITNTDTPAHTPSPSTSYTFFTTLTGFNIFSSHPIMVLPPITQTSQTSLLVNNPPPKTTPPVQIPTQPSSPKASPSPQSPASPKPSPSPEGPTSPKSSPSPDAPASPNPPTSPDSPDSPTSPGTTTPHESGGGGSGPGDQTPPGTGSSPKDSSPSLTVGPAGTTVFVQGTPVVEGLPGAVVAGTTYSLAPSGKLLYVNGTPAVGGIVPPTETDSAHSSSGGGGSAAMHKSSAGMPKPQITSKPSKPQSTFKPSPVKPATSTGTWPSNIAPGSDLAAGSSSAGSVYLPCMSLIVFALTVVAFM